MAKERKRAHGSCIISWASIKSQVPLKTSTEASKSITSLRISFLSMVCILKLQDPSNKLWVSEKSGVWSRLL